MKQLKTLCIVAMLPVILLIAMAVYAENKSPMFSRQVPGGLFAVTNDTQTTGNIWFVDSGSANASDAAGYGQNPDAPFATIDYAIGQATANNGDWIMVMPGHAENISTANKISLDVAGLRIIGLGIGQTRPKLSWTAAAGYIGVNAANCSIENMVFDVTPGAGKSALAGVSLNVLATDFLFKNNTVLMSDGAGQAAYVVYAWSGGTRFTIDNCDFLGDTSSASGVSSVIYVSGGKLDDVQIKNTKIITYSTSAAIYNASSTATGFYVVDTSVYNGTNATTRCLESSVGGWLRNVISSYLGGVTLTTSAIPNTDPL